MSNLIDLKVRRGQTAAGYRTRAGYWKKSQPFVENARAHLIRRPLSINEHRLSGHGRHISIEYLCGQTTTGLKKFTFHDVPPENGVVCAVCEARAIMAGLPSSAEIAGRHVHIGRMRAVLTCAHGTGEDRAL